MEGIIIVDQEGKILVANQASEAMFGYTEGGLIGLGLENLLPERYRKNHFNLRNMFMARPEPRVMGAGRDLMASRKDGKEFPPHEEKKKTHASKIEPYSSICFSSRQHSIPKRVH